MQHPSPPSSNISFAIIESSRKWWNWQTHHLEGVAPKGVGVQIPPSAPNFGTYHTCLNPLADTTDGYTGYRDHDQLGSEPMSKVVYVSKSTIERKQGPLRI